MPLTALALLFLFPSASADPVDPTAVQPVIEDCAVRSGYSVNSWTGEASDASLWVAGIYETYAEGEEKHPMGAAKVTFDLPGDNVLALSSYEPVTWTLELGDKAEISQILLVGYYDQKVVGAGDIPVRTFKKPSCGFRWGVPDKSCKGEDLVAMLAGVAGRKATRFDGCYRASSFRYTQSTTP